jgi:hypothetical protein
MCGQLDDEPIRQRLDRVVVVLLDGFGWRAADRDDCAVDHTIGSWPVVGLSVALCFAPGLDDHGCLILRPHVATGDRQQTLSIDADEDAGAGDLGRIVDKRSRFQDGPRRLDFSEALINLVRQFVGVLVILLDLGVLGIECVKRRPLLLRQTSRFALNLAQPVSVAVGEVDCQRDPLPTFGRDRLGLGLQLLGGETIEQRHILQPAAIVVCEQIP